MADPRHIFGRNAEDAVAAWLASRGWTLLARRYRSSAGAEVDLVLLDPDRILVGVEVRARRSRRAGSPGETVDPARARRTARTLVAYAAANRVAHAGLRVDLVAVTPLDGMGNRYLRLRRVPDIAS